MIDFPRSRKLQFGLYALALGLALTVRLVRLGAWPLTDEEARWAMQAFDLLKGLRPEIGPQPAYTLLTALTFFVAQASDYAARFIPALFGAALVLAPYFFRDRLGEKAALVLAFLLAFEPGLLSMSRMAGSPIIVVSATLLAWGLWRTGNARAAGILAGIALLGGPQLWPGLIGLAVAYGLVRGLVPQVEPVQFERQAVIRALVFAAGTYLILGSFFLFVPGGLSAGLQSLTVYFGGWLDFTDVPAWRLLLALAVYQFPALILAAVALVRGISQRDGQIMALGLWALVTLVLALANPSRQVYDLVWTLLPLWTLAALEAARHLTPMEDSAWETLGMLAFTVVILAFSALNFTNIALVPMDEKAMQLRWVLLAAGLALLLLSIFMVAYGWSVSVARQGAIWGALVILAVYSLATAMAAGELRVYRTAELWSPGLYVEQADTLVSQLRDIAHWRIGAVQPLDISVAGVDSPALHWALRDWDVKYTNAVTITENPSVLIVPSQANSPELQSGYRGQDLIWRTAPAWNGALPTDWLRWAILHTMPQGQEKIILWARSDLFIDSQNTNP